MLADAALFQDGETVRLSQNDPDGSHIPATFFGLTPKGLTISVPAQADIARQDAWTLDEDVIDLTDFYLKALAELAATAHGRDAVLPALLGETGWEIDFEAHAESCDSLDDSGLDDSQIDAVANCLAADRFHLVQGPPGTGKTFALARLVQKLVDQGQRVLVTAFTHRAIHHALRKIAPMVDCPVFKVSDPFPFDAEGIEFKERFADTGLLDHPGPYVVGCTPFALFSSRAGEARFDVAVIDETSQMRIEAAVMPMLRAQRWFFFGDRQQLPPVVMRPVDDAAEDSVFARLSRSGGHTMLATTYRMNDPLTRWPSEMFYQRRLTAHRTNAGHRFALKSTRPTGLLGPEPSMVSVPVDHEGNRVVSDEEANETAALVEAMLDGGLAPREIGVVVPFRAQAARIRGLLRFHRFAERPDIGDLTVDTVERFQGQEREAMIVSFVASDDGFLDRVGRFLTYPQRLNVAVTRARTKVLLVHSPRFRAWLERNAPHDERAAVALSLLESAR
ncbi:MAG: AAA family ATPase [Akkermansiaceae bacterium]|nr:AAA family ATPase [Akkermansiaceae bacterium]MCP5544297.1 AAA family ATPase [Akkermansiaceae bacterium]MCP5546979.1 AAA family ATPase [Akkermansiaceae bacterium]